MKMSAKLVLTFASLIVMICVSRQVAWAITPTVAASPSPYTGNCPGTISFTGTITATAAGTVSYEFEYTPPGQTTALVPKVQSITVKSPGPVMVSGSGGVTLSGIGTVVLLETAPVKAASNPATFKAVCSSSAMNYHYPVQKPQISRNAVQMPYSSTTQSLSLVASDSRIQAYNYGGADVFNSCGNGQPLCVGYYHNESDVGPIVSTHQILTWRSYYLFQPVKIPSGSQLTKATLTVNASNWPSNCYGGIAPAVSDWTTTKSYTDGNFTYAIPTSFGGPNAEGFYTVTFFVTPIVKDWVSGKIPNHGFVLRGSDENGSGPNNVYCVLNFAGAGKLVITLTTPVLQYHQ